MKDVLVKRFVDDVCWEQYSDAYNLAASNRAAAMIE